MGVGAQIKEKAREKGMTLRKLAEKAGISYNTLYSITKRDSERVSIETLQRIATALNVPIQELMDMAHGGEMEAQGIRGLCEYEDTPTEKIPRHIRLKGAQLSVGDHVSLSHSYSHFSMDPGESDYLNRAMLAKQGPPSSQLPADATPIDFSKYHQIPILGRISAGLPLYADEHIESYTLTELNGGAEYFALRVHGDSMNGLRINDGDIIIVRRQEEVEQGEVAVVLVDHEDATVKRFYTSDTTVTLMPQSTNPEHAPQIYDIGKTDIRVLGKVVEVKFQL